MKNKQMVIAIAVVFVLGLIFGVTSLSGESKAFSVGKVIEYEDGTIIFADNNTPVLVSDRTKDGSLFSALTDGDKVLLLHDEIQETYPAQTGGYFVLRLKNGQRSDLPEEFIEQLTQLGYLK